jgi:hypothetical protein
VPSLQSPGCPASRRRRCELLMAVTFHVVTDDGAIENVEGGEERRGAMAFVVVRHRAGAARLHRQAWWCRDTRRTRPGHHEARTPAATGDDGAAMKVMLEADRLSYSFKYGKCLGFGDGDRSISAPGSLDL